MLITFQINREARLGLTHQSPQSPEPEELGSPSAAIFVLLYVGEVTILNRMLGS